MRILPVLALCVFLGATFAGCSGSSGTSTTPKATTKATTTGKATTGHATTTSPTTQSETTTGEETTSETSTTSSGTDPSSGGGTGNASFDPRDRTLPRPALVQPTARPDVTVGDGGEGEPNLLVSPDGNLYASPITPLYRSTDGGRSWRNLGANVGTGDGDIAADAAGNVYWLGLGNGIEFQVSHDQGETFSASVDIGEGQGTDREWIDATPDGHLYAYWRDNRGLIFRSSPDGGATWTPAKVVRSDAGANGPLTHDPYDPQSVYFVVPSNGLQLLASHDGGATWDQQRVATPSSGIVGVAFATTIFPVVAVDTAGTLYVVWSSPAGLFNGVKEQSQQGVFLVSSTDRGATWTRPVQLSDSTKDARLPWIAAGLPGRVAVTWYESVAPYAPSESVPNEWNVVLWESVTADSPAPQGLKVQLNSQVAHIGGVCTIGLACLAGGDRSLADFFETTIGKDGQPISVWMQSIAGTGISGIWVSGGVTVFGGVASGTPLL